MVMGRRPDVETAAAPIAALTIVGLVEQLGVTLASLPFRKPWEGPDRLVDNLGAATTRQVMRTFMGYSTALPTPEFRSLEMAIDEICRVVLPPFVKRLGVETRRAEVGGVPGIWYQPADTAARGVVLYLHGGGYIGTSPSMYAAFNGYLAHATRCDLFVADYRLAPEFPFPAGLIDVISVLEALYDDGADPDALFVAGDSGGGGLANTLLLDARAHHLARPAGLILFSPEVDLILDERSVTQNAGLDILPWNIPVAPYLHGLDPHNKYVSTINADLGDFPPTFVCFGDQEMFRDPIRRFVERLVEAGVDTTVIEEPEMFHVYPFLMPWASAAQRAYSGASAFVEGILGLPAVRVVDGSTGADEPSFEDASPVGDTVGSAGQDAGRAT